MQHFDPDKSTAADLLRIAADTDFLGFRETAEAMRFLAELYAELDDVRSHAEAAALRRKA